MRALQARELAEGGQGLTVVELEDPRPARGEVVVDVAVSPFTPADRMLRYDELTKSASAGRTLVYPGSAGPPSPEGA